jgi:hypothetical protein
MTLIRNRFKSRVNPLTQRQNTFPTAFTLYTGVVTSSNSNCSRWNEEKFPILFPQNFWKAFIETCLLTSGHLPATHKWRRIWATIVNLEFLCRSTVSFYVATTTTNSLGVQDTHWCSFKARKLGEKEKQKLSDFYGKIYISIFATTSAVVLLVSIIISNCKWQLVWADNRKETLVKYLGFNVSSKKKTKKLHNNRIMCNSV